MSIQDPRWGDSTHVTTLFMVGPPPNYRHLEFGEAVAYLRKISNHFRDSIAQPHQGESLDYVTEYWNEYQEWYVQQRYPQASWPGIRIHWWHALNPSRVSPGNKA